MQRLGRALHVSPSRNIIIKLQHVPKIGETVVDENLKLIGKVFDILGPISSPYASIKTIKQEPEKLVNRMLYVSLRKEKGERLNERR